MAPWYAEALRVVWLDTGVHDEWSSLPQKLRRARERTASPTYPDMCLSRQELAGLVNTWVWEHHDETVTASGRWVGKLERGDICWPGKLYRAALRELLGVPTDAALGFVNARALRAVVKLDNVDSNKVLPTRRELGALAALGPMMALLEGIKPTPTPRRVGATDIEQTRAAARMFQSWVRIYGGGVARDAVMGQLRWSVGLFSAICPARLRPELFSAVGDLAHIAGHMALDAGAYEEARQMFGGALACAEQAGDWHLRASVLDSLAWQAIQTGQPDEGLTQVEHALVRVDRLTATELTVLHVTRACTLAKMRRVSETLTAAGTAEDHFAHSTPANDPPFLTHYNAVFLSGGNGQALFDLALLGHNVEQATDRLTAAAAGHTDGRPRAIYLTKLASLTMATGDPIQAATIGAAALDAASTIRSRSAADDLRELARYATAHENLDEVAHLRHRINTLLVRADSP
ncbi:MAG: XRE family transcriptional regulator [Pseudonocardiaceae bacterium]